MKILILDGDDLEQTIDVKNKFVFLFTDKDIYHINSTDGILWKAHKNLRNLRKGHQELIKKILAKK